MQYILSNGMPSSLHSGIPPSLQNGMPSSLQNPLAQLANNSFPFQLQTNTLVPTVGQLNTQIQTLTNAAAAALQPSTLTPTLQPSRTLATPARTKIPWSTPGVQKLAVETVVQIQIWDPSSQKDLKGKIMGKYNEGVAFFCAGLQAKFLVKLKKKPTWQTIQNRVIKVLLAHRAYRNKQRNKTGDGERTGVCNHLSVIRIAPNNTILFTHVTDEVAETQSDRDSRMEREALYDQVLYTSHSFKLNT